MKTFEDVPINKVRSFWNERPCNLRHSKKPVGTAEYFNEVETRKYFVEPHIPAFADFESWRGKKVLEIGCGLGTDTINFARHGAQVTAVDLSEESLKLARRRAEVFGVQNQIQFHHSNAEDLDKVLAPQTFDLIYSFGVLHHTPHPDQAFRQLRKYADAGTTFKLMVYNHYSWKVLWILLSYGKLRFWRLNELVAKFSEAQTGCPVTYTYTAEQMRASLEGAGFRVSDVQIDHIFPYRISDYKEHRYVKTWYFRHIPDSLFRRLERSLGWHLCVTAKPI